LKGSRRALPVAGEASLRIKKTRSAAPRSKEAAGQCFRHDQTAGRLCESNPSPAPRKTGIPIGVPVFCCVIHKVPSISDNGRSFYVKIAWEGFEGEQASAAGGRRSESANQENTECRAPLQGSGRTMFSSRPNSRQAVRIKSLPCTQKKQASR